MSARGCIRLGIGLFAVSAGICVAQTAAMAADVSKPAQPEVSFQFERPGMAVPRFTLLVREDGTGTYKAEEAPVSGGNAALQPTTGKQINRAITLSQSTVANLFKTARSLDHFNMECASKAKNIADTGKKTLTYSGADGHGSCTYNYSENKTVTSLTDTFQAIAFTLDEGRRLDYLHRYDRLGLDAEMESLSHEHDMKRALELGTIAPTLTSLANDDALMQRVRMRAVKLLDQAGDKGNK
jgi:hypothetical protein